MIYRRVLNVTNGRQHLHNYLIFSRIAYTQCCPHDLCLCMSGGAYPLAWVSFQRLWNWSSLNYYQCSQAFPLIGRHFLMSPRPYAFFFSAYIRFHFFSFSLVNRCSRSRRVPRPARISPSAYHACYPNPSRRITTTTTTIRTAPVQAPVVTTTTMGKKARRRSCCRPRIRTWPPISWPPALPTRRTEAPRPSTPIRICTPRRRQRPLAMCCVCRPSERRSPGRCRRCITRRWPIRRSRIGWQVSQVEGVESVGRRPHVAVAHVRGVCLLP